MVCDTVGGVATMQDTFQKHLRKYFQKHQKIRGKVSCDTVGGVAAMQDTFQKHLGKYFQKYQEIRASFL